MLVSPGSWGPIHFRGKNIAVTSTDPADPGTNQDYLRFSGSQLVSVRPDDPGSGEGGGYFRFNRAGDPSCAWIDGATGMAGASADTVELLLPRADNGLTTDTLYVWAVIVDPSAPSSIKASAPTEAAVDNKIDTLDELQALTEGSAIPDWREY